MRKINWLLLSLWLNLLLTGGIITVLKIPARHVEPKVRVMEKKVFAVAPKTAKTNSAAAITANSPSPFSWRQIESEDFPTYIANLRKVACPEATIHDIITADVNEMYVHRRQEIFAPLQNQFWEIVARLGQPDSFDPDLKEKVEKLAKEKNELLKKLLGNESAEEKKPENLEPVFERQMADFLPEEKIKALHEIGVKFSEQVRQLTKDNPDGANSKEIKEKTAELRKQCRAEQEALLTPAELDEFKLRSSRVRNELTALVGFEANEDELRQIARFKKDIDPKAPDAKEKIAAANEEIKKFLGDERFAAFQRAQDPQFRDIYTVASRYNLPEETINNVYEMKRDVTKQMQQVRNDKSLSAEERDDMLEAMQKETERAFSAALGTNVFKTYRKHGGEWIEKLGGP